MAKVTFKYEDGIILAVLSGEITLLESNDLKEKIKDELARLKTFKLVLDLSQVPLLDSSGLGMLIALFKHINQKEGAIIYVGITDYVKKIIGFAKLDKIFTIVDTLEEAMKILKQ